MCFLSVYECEGYLQTESLCLFLLLVLEKEEKMMGERMKGVKNESKKNPKFQLKNSFRAKK